jgi:multisubunit Na+/H+ antiporter MnhB subunit
MCTMVVGWLPLNQKVRGSNHESAIFLIFLFSFFLPYILLNFPMIFLMKFFNDHLYFY